jgi:6-phosphogluconate dehydrogenase
MKIGMVGLGRMGANMAERLVHKGHQVIGYDPQEAARQRVEALDMPTVGSLQALVDLLEVPRVVWMMVPAGAPVDDTLDELTAVLAPGDTLVDGGNSNYKDTLRRAAHLKKKRLHYVDCGTSGGVWGLKEGYSMMVGGDPKTVEPLRPIFEALAPGKDQGWGHVGPIGSGHFTKMVHNGIEYGLMQAYAEGFSILKHKQEFKLDLHQVGEIWRYGSVVRSWLLELTTDALGKNPEMDGVAPYVVDSGEGRWTVAAALELDVPAPIITAALIERLRSRDSDSFADKLLSSMRNEFGGHAIKKE